MVPLNAGNDYIGGNTSRHSKSSSDDEREDTAMINDEEEGYEDRKRRKMLRLLAMADSKKKKKKKKKGMQFEPDGLSVFHQMVFAGINIIISAPGLYGYAAVIFNHAYYSPYKNALSKLVIWSSLVHQLGFTLFSTLPFAIGTVQDAGLIFLSAMSNIIADAIIEENSVDGVIDEALREDTEKQIVSTALVLLSLYTASLGFVLILMGKFGLADIVSYIPLPTIGGYLAFIGYFCLEAGIGLCISENMTEMQDWKYLLSKQNCILALPGLLSGVVLTYIARCVSNSAVLPMAMVAIPAIFYVVIYAGGWGLEGAREYKWVGEESAPVPIQDLFQLIDFSLVRWSLLIKCFPTWIGMIFVVSFGSCLDVAAIALDMGEILDVNSELCTVGICNVMSGLSCGFTGSYIFSQTNFTYRTGSRSRLVGILCIFAFLGIVLSTVNLLSVGPLFFFGSTLIFIGYDLLYEWLIEVRHKLFMTEYLVLIVTFVAIQFIGIDFGILLGVLVAIVDYVVTTTSFSIRADPNSSSGGMISTNENAVLTQRVTKYSLTVWTPDDWKLLQQHAYEPNNPKIITLQIRRPVFFGSSLQLLQGLSDEIGIADDEMEEEEEDFVRAAVYAASPHIKHMVKGPYDNRPSPLMSPTSALLKSPTMPQDMLISWQQQQQSKNPKFVVLDLSQMTNLDASACRGCFLPLVQMCAKRQITLIGTCANSRVDWMMRSHDVAYVREEEKRIKRQMISWQGNMDREMVGNDEMESECCKILLFLTLFDALEFCETIVLQSVRRDGIPIGGNDGGGSDRSLGLGNKKPSFLRLDEWMDDEDHSNDEGTQGNGSNDDNDPNLSLSHVLSHILGLGIQEEEKMRATLEGPSSEDRRDIIAMPSVVGKRIKTKSFYDEINFDSGDIILQKDMPTDAFYIVLKGAVAAIRKLDETKGTELNRGTVTGLLQMGAVFGFVDFLLERPRTINVVAVSKHKTTVAKISRKQLKQLEKDHPHLGQIIRDILLKASVQELANCTCCN